MSRLFVLIVLLGTVCGLYAQGDVLSSRAVGESVEELSSAEFERLQREKEARLADQVTRYTSLSSDSQHAAKAKIRDMLYELFDLSMIEKEQEAIQLRQQLERLKNDPSHRHQYAEIQTLEQALNRIESSLTFRRQNRDRIVSQRMAELL